MYSYEPCIGDNSPGLWSVFLSKAQMSCLFLLNTLFVPPVPRGLLVVPGTLLGPESARADADGLCSAGVMFLGVGAGNRLQSDGVD